MTKNRYVVGNLKMEMNSKDVSNYLKIVNSKIFTNQVILCPTSIYTPYFLKQYYRVGLQNIHYKEGAYTGEISPKQAVSMGISCVIIGHSERRQYFHETDEVIRKKVAASLDQGLSVILCIGETELERSSLKTDIILKRQIVAALRGIENLHKVMIAYEPVWAIGTNKVLSNKDIESATDYIKGIVNQQYSYSDIKVLYGGSVDEKNIHEIAKIKNLDGVLVGKASTNADKFLHIIEVVLGK